MFQRFSLHCYGACKRHSAYVRFPPKLELTSCIYRISSGFDAPPATKMFNMLFMTVSPVSLYCRNTLAKMEHVSVCVPTQSASRGRSPTNVHIMNEDGNVWAFMMFTAYNYLHIMSFTNGSGLQTWTEMHVTGFLRKFRRHWFFCGYSTWHLQKRAPPLCAKYSGACEHVHVEVLVMGCAPVLLGISRRMGVGGAPPPPFANHERRC